MRVRLIQVEERNHASSARNVEKRLQRLESTLERDNAGIQVLNRLIQVRRLWKKVSRTYRDAL